MFSMDAVTSAEPAAISSVAAVFSFTTALTIGGSIAGTPGVHHSWLSIRALPTL